MTSRNKHRERSRKSHRKQSVTMDAVRQNSYKTLITQMSRSKYGEGSIKQLIASFMNHARRPRESRGTEAEGKAE